MTDITIFRLERRLLELESFLINDVTKTLNEVSTALGMYGRIGGSCGFLLYGIRLNRVPKDIDVIVDKDYFDEVAAQIKRNPLIEVNSESPSDIIGKFKHISFRTIKGHIFDVIENHLDEEIVFNKVKPFPVCLEQLVKAKRLYERPKDIKDMGIIENFILSNNITNEE